MGIRTTAPMVSQTGKQVGQWPKRLGVAAMKARAALQQQEGVLRLCAEVSQQRLCSRRFSLIVAVLALVPSSGAQHQLSEGSDRSGEEVVALAFVPSSSARPLLSERYDVFGLVQVEKKKK